MTRINVIPPKELTTKHLVAEYREITRLPTNLKMSLNRKGKKFSLTEIPNEYVLGTGHVKFFFNKMKFLKNRFESLVDEMLKRGYNPTYRDSNIFIAEENFMNDYTPTEDAIRLNRERIKERLNGKILVP
jgi:deoxyribonuclease (pyrimidine dimer)